MSDLPDNGLGPIVNLRIKLTAAQKEIERLTKELDHALSDTACYRDEGYKLTAEIERLQTRNEVLKNFPDTADLSLGHCTRTNPYCRAMAAPAYKMSHMIVCKECGDKRCPKADDCNNRCVDQATGRITHDNEELIMANRYDYPVPMMINSGTFWRCHHGYTVFNPCWKCGLFHPIRHINALWINWKHDGHGSDVHFVK